MTILDQIKAGRLVVVPPVSVKLTPCDCERGHNGIGLSGRECDCAPDHTTALLSLVVGMERERERAESAINALDQERDGFAQLCAVRTGERDAAQEQADSFKAMYRQACDWRDEKIAAAEARALAAEAKADALREAVAKAHDGLKAGIAQYASRDLHGNEVAGDEQYPWVRAMQIGRDAAARALTEQPNVGD